MTSASAGHDEGGIGKAVFSVIFATPMFAMSLAMSVDPSSAGHFPWVSALGVSITPENAWYGVAFGTFMLTYALVIA
jgi:hypothetical protein